MDDESPNGVKYIHANSNLIGFLNGAGNWMTTWDNNGNQINRGNLEIYNDNIDNQLRFHDSGDAWYSIGIDASDSRKFKINYGGTL